MRAAREGGPVGLVKEPDPPLDPLCAWRVDDAEIENVHDAIDTQQLGSDGAAQARQLRAQMEHQHAGLEKAAGNVDPMLLDKVFRAQAPRVAKCVKDVPRAKPVLRVRVAFDAAGAVTSALTDYAVELPDAAKSCVIGELDKIHLAKPSSKVTVVFRFGTQH